MSNTGWDFKPPAANLYPNIARVLPYKVKSDKEYKYVEKEKGNISRSPQLAYNKLTEARGKEKKKEKTIQ